MALACSLLAAGAIAAPAPWHDGLEWRGRSVAVEAVAAGGGLVDYRFRGTAPAEEARARTVREAPGRPRLRSGNPLFDGLFALALEEVAEDSVEQITDGQFNDGRPIPCHCFETGARWHYVWTRDISYSVDLALSYLDASRARDSLLFKQSGLRVGGTGAQLVAQDTGSGGSWPVSSDRVVWIHAAVDVLHALPAADAAALEPEIYRIARDTLEQDHRYAFDARAGLYRGETSFLDWREQNYPPWTRADTRFIAESFALSTNVLHYVALKDLAELARRAGRPRAGDYAVAARDLKRRINERFWQAGAGLYASYLDRELVPAAGYDLLGLALAVIHGVADESRARQVLAHYPLTAAGPPVIFPEQPGIAIYHNRALWPFVTAYALAAARRSRDPVRMSAYAESLLRGAAFGLSNMENFEFLTQAGTFADGPLSGPVINSPRQLWSVAGYVSMVVGSLFGVAFDTDGMTVAPALPGALAARLFAGSRALSLESLAARGRTVDVRLELPPSYALSDWLQAARITVNGKQLTDGRIRLAGTVATNLHVVVTLVATPAVVASAMVLDAADAHALTPAERHQLFAPPPPGLASVARTDGVAEFALAALEPGHTWHLYRDGMLLASGYRGERVLDPGPDPQRTACYAATQQAPDDGHVSLRSQEVCLTGRDSRQSFTAAAGTLESPDHHPLTTGDGLPRYADWGESQQRLQFEFVPSVAGRTRLALAYSNGSGPVNTGITAAVKAVAVTCGHDATPQTGALVMPQLADAHVVGESTGFVFTAARAARCRVTITDGVNMSYLAHFALYTGGKGGRDGPWNRADVVAAHVDSIPDVPRERR